MDFIQEFKSLLFATPTYNLRSVNNVNCPYVHMITFSKNSYMCFSGYKIEDCGYCYNPWELRDCYDTWFLIKCELCYECISCINCYNCDFCMECTNCTDCRFCYDCRGCRNCFGCVGLRQKEFHIFNTPYSKEEYVKKMNEMRLANKHEVQKHLRKMDELRLTYPHVANVQINAQNCFGDHVLNSKNCYWAFDVKGGSEDCCYIYHNEKLKDCVDSEYLAPSELLYECTVGFDLYNCNFCFECGNLKNSEFCVRCFNSHDLFGCVGRNHAEYQILNQQYEKEKYFKKVEEIKDQLKREKQYKNWLPEVIGKID